jgi:hypothetical protein
VHATDHSPRLVRTGINRNRYGLGIFMTTQPIPRQIWPRVSEPERVVPTATQSLSLGQEILASPPLEGFAKSRQLRPSQTAESEPWSSKLRGSYPKAKQNLYEVQLTPDKSTVGRWEPRGKTRGKPCRRPETAPGKSCNAQVPPALDSTSAAEFWPSCQRPTISQNEVTQDNESGGYPGSPTKLSSFKRGCGGTTQRFAVSSKISDMLQSPLKM